MINILFNLFFGHLPHGKEGYNVSISEKGPFYALKKINVSVTVIAILEYR